MNMKKFFAIVAALAVCCSLNAQGNEDDNRLLPGSWVREKGEIVEIGVLEEDTHCLSYEEIVAGLPAEDFIALKKAFNAREIGISLIADGIGYSLGFVVGELLYCTLMGYDFNKSGLIACGVGAAVALSGAIVVPIANKKIDKVIDRRNTSIGLGPDRDSAPAITILPTVVAFNGPAAPAAGSAVKVAPGLGISVRF